MAISHQRRLLDNARPSLRRGSRPGRKFCLDETHASCWRRHFSFGPPRIRTGVLAEDQSAAWRRDDTFSRNAVDMATAVRKRGWQLRARSALYSQRRLELGLP